MIVFDTNPITFFFFVLGIYSASDRMKKASNVLFVFILNWYKMVYQFFLVSKTTDTAISECFSIDFFLKRANEYNICGGCVININSFPIQLCM